MEVFRWPGGKPPSARPTVATLGVFDGVHVGHQHIVRRVVTLARERDARTAVITFDRHPQQALGGAAEPCITSLEHRLRLFEELGADACLVIEFTPEVAQMEAEDFARAVLRDALGVELLLVGEDCRFGRGRRGDVALLRGMAVELGLDAAVVEPVKVGGEVVSSTAIRQAVTAGDFARAQELLGRPFSLLGTVVRGSGHGRSLGFPTANLDVHNELIPCEGVYASWFFVGGQRGASVSSIGRRETFERLRTDMPEVEVHVLDGEPSLYGRQVEVQFVRRLRAQQRFGSAGALTRQIEADCAEARRLLAEVDA